MSKNRLMAGIGIVTAFVLLAAACGSSTGNAGGNTSGGAAGSVQVSGSSTVEPISVRVAELLSDVNPDVEVNVDGPGTGDGFALFCDGQTDISDASRPIKDEEKAKCDANNITYTEIKVAQDGITVMANPANPLECVNFADLYALFGPESKDVNNFRDATDLASELGSDTVFPDQKLDINAPGAESGTFGSFIEIALKDTYESRVAGGLAEVGGEPIRNYAGQADDNIIIQGIEGSDGGFGYVGFAFAEQAGSGVKELSVAADPGGECVSPSAETIADNSYPISRPLYLYVNNAKAAANPGVGAYVDYYLGDGYSAVEEVGYVALDDAAKAESVSAWDASKG